MPKNYGSNTLIKNEGFNSLGDPTDDKTNDLYARLFTSFRALTDAFIIGGDIVQSTLGKGRTVKEGASGKLGVATLVAGTVTIPSVGITANARILYSRKTIGGTVGNMSYTVVANTSFTLNSSSATDTSTIVYEVVEPTV